jgi:DNA-binding Xre family transcriptional regulator
MTISQQLRTAIASADDTIYRIAKEAEVDWGTIARFLDGTRPNLRIDTVDKLCEHLGLELRPKRAVRKSRSRNR